MFRKSVVDQDKLDMCIKKQNHSKEDSIKIIYSKYFIIDMGLGDPTTYLLINSFSMKMKVMTQRLNSIYYAWNGIVHQVK